MRSSPLLQAAYVSACYFLHETQIEMRDLTVFSLCGDRRRDVNCVCVRGRGGAVWHSVACGRWAPGRTPNHQFATVNKREAPSHLNLLLKKNTHK